MSSINCRAFARNSIGHKYGRLTITQYVGLLHHKEGNKSWATLVECLCDCGTVKQVAYGMLRSGQTKSCGCYARETSSDRCKSYRTHQMTGTPTYRTWRSMIGRCTKSNYKKYELYGGRGITVCDKWSASFESFLADMGERPTGMTLDRYPNQNGNYEPGNCRWATVAEQNRNRRNNVLITYRGRTMTAPEWARETGLNHQLIWRRARRGIQGDDLFAPISPPPSHCPRGHEYAGENLVVRKDRRRVCRICTRSRGKEYKLKAKRNK